MDISRNEVLRKVLEAFDTIDELQFDNMLLRKRIDELERATQAEPDEGFSRIDLEVLKAGRKAILKDCTHLWDSSVRIRVDEDIGEVGSIESYENWRKKYVYKVLDSMSRDDFYVYFDDELRETYNKERETALADIHNGEV